MFVERLRRRRRAEGYRADDQRQGGTRMNVTPAKRAANRANAQKSTGPRTAAGKKVSRLNGLRHGLRAELVVVPQLEDAGEWEAHRAGIVESLAPANYLEELLADRAAIATWRLQRATRYERAVLMHAQTDAEKDAGDSLYLYGRDGNRVATLEEARRAVTHYRDAIDALERLPAADDESEEIENGYAFTLIKETAAHVASIALVVYNKDGSDEYEDLPEEVYREPEDAGDYPTFGELGALLEAIAKHDRNTDAEADVRGRTLAELRYRLYVAEQNEAKLQEAIATKREAHTLPIDFAGHDGRRHDELLARYETAAEKTLERALTGLQVVRGGLGSVGKTEHSRNGISLAKRTST
jgi:hypothetical protein